MTKAERTEFIERMEEAGDIWEDADVKRVYGNMSLDEALVDRRTSLSMMDGLLFTVHEYLASKED